jgi:chromate transporter
VTWGPFDLEYPHLDSIQVTQLAITALAFVLVFVAKWGVLRILATCASVGLVAHLALGLG